jgi:hypothetical protein
MRRISGFLLAVFLGSLGWMVFAVRVSPGQTSRPGQPERFKAVATETRSPLPDLAVAFIKPGALNTTIMIGQDIGQLVQLRVYNGGQALVPKYGIAIVLSTNPSIIFSPNPHESVTTGRMIGQKVVSTPLAAGKSQDITIKPVQVPDDISWGDYYLTAIVDPGKAVAESNENNNQAQKMIFVQARLDFIDRPCRPNNGPVYVSAHGKGFGYWKSTLVARVGPYTIPTVAADWHNDVVWAFPTPGLIPIGTQVYDWGLYDGSRAICQIRKAIWQAWLLNATPSEGSPGTSVKIDCCTCCSSQGTKKLCLWRWTDNLCVAEVPVVSWSDKQIICTIPEIAPGQYVFAVYDHGQRITLTVGGEVAYFTVK